MLMHVNKIHIITSAHSGIVGTATLTELAGLAGPMGSQILPSTSPSMSPSPPSVNVTVSTLPLMDAPENSLHWPGLSRSSIGKMNGLMGVDLLAYSVDLAG